MMVPMNKDNHFFPEKDSLRTEIAMAAARLIAEEGVSYGAAKRKAAKQMVGDERAAREVLPSNAQIEDELRSYNELFLSDSQPARLKHLREIALEVMEALGEFQPYITGAVLNGTAGEHSEIHLQLFVDNPKDVEIHLLNQNIDFDVYETPHFKPNQDDVETLSFLYKNEGVHLALYSTDDLRGALKVRQGEVAGRFDLTAARAAFGAS
jgi:hypothetical protein